MLCQIDKYDLVEKLGEGGFGVVYKARHSVTKLPVAIKILTTGPDAQPEVATRFRREASIGNEIDHENIVHALDFGEVDGRPYLVLEFLDGMSLAEAVRVGGPMAPSRAAAIGRQVADALAAAHAHGVIHRDLKPENIFLVRRGGRGDFVKVLDFGIAKLTAGPDDGLRTRSQVVIGSPVTMSPEQCRGAEIDRRSDIYALGVVLFHAVAGRYPFYGPPGDILSMHLRDPPPRLGDVRVGVPSALEAVVARALEKEPGARFGSMAEMAQALAPLGGQTAAEAPTVATPRARGRQPRMWRRPAVLLALAVIVAVALGAGWLGRKGVTSPGGRAQPSATPGRDATAAGQRPSRETGPTASEGTRAGGTSRADEGTRAEGTSRADEGTRAGGMPRVDEGTRAGGMPKVDKAARANRATRVGGATEADEAMGTGGAVVTTGTNADKGAEAQGRRGVGYLSVAVLPFAEVLVDGHVVGTTPLRRVPLRPGSHTLELRNAGLHRQLLRTERIEPGAHRRVQIDWSN